MKKILLILVLIFIISTTSCSFKQLFCKHDYQLTEEIDSTCNSKGHKDYTCSKCGKTKEEIILKKDHNYVVTEEVAATCTKNGTVVKTCQNCGDKTTTIIDKLPHDFSELLSIVPADCTNSEQKIYKCHNCDEQHIEHVGSPLGHKFGSYSVKEEATDTKDGILVRTCEICGAVEETIIPSNNYIDLSAIKYDYRGEDYNYNIDTKEEMAVLFNSAILHNAQKIKVTAKFDTTDILDYLGEHYNIGLSYRVKASIAFNQITFTLEYGTLNPTVSASKDNQYRQYDSLNLTYKIAEEDKRSSDFDNFKIDSSSLSLDNVKTSFQLFYALERFAKPNCVVGSKAYYLYENMKTVLRNIISDKMNDVEKLRAIYEYIVMNVCYDKALYSLINSMSNSDVYKGFRLEGVFEDKRAVCEGISQAVACLCNIEGIRCVQETGHPTSNPHGVGHAWNKVYVNGSWYILDATSGGTIIGSGDDAYEVLTYNYFLISTETYKDKYTGENFEYIICIKDYNIYDEMYYTLHGVQKSFYVDNFEELVNVMSYFELNKTKYSTLEIKFNYKVDSISSEVSRGFTQVGHVGPFNYIEGDNTVLLVND